MPGFDDKIRRKDLFAAEWMNALFSNPHSYAAWKHYVKEVGYNRVEEAEAMARIAYSVADIMQAESELH